MNTQLGATEKELIETRKNKLFQLEKLGVNPYPSKSYRDTTAAEAEKNKDDLINSKKEITVAGRIMGLRGHGKLIFADLEDESGKIQTVFKFDLLGEKPFELIKLLDLGDFLEVKCTLFVTNSGELTVEAHGLRILTKAIRPLPDKHFGLKDEETILRKRYIELILNPELRALFIRRARFWQATRDFLVKKGFLEVETPVLETTAGGADANPFVTHHDALDIDVYLRISMGELWQKRLMVGGFEKTFEIGRQFRNEGMSREHLQDYTQMEFYWGYANYEDSSNLVKEMYRYIAKETFGTAKFKIGKFEIDLDQEWEKIDYASTVKERLGIDVLEASDEEIRAKIRELKLDFDPNDSRGRLIDTLWKSIRKEIAGPALLVIIRSRFRLWPRGERIILD
jgi:lysyl-tRNA synthetase class 2